MHDGNDFASDEYFEAAGNAVERMFATFLLAGLLLVNVAVIGLRVADFPVRALGAIVLLCAAIALYPERFLNSVRKFSLVLWLTAGFAVLGAFVSAVNGASFREIWQGLMEVPLQAAVTLLVASILAQIAGFRLSLIAFVGVIAGSAFVAILQFIGIEAAWQLREWLGALQKEELFTPLLNRRPMGISYSPIQLSTQLCVAFGVFAAARGLRRDQGEGENAVDPLIIMALMFVIVGSLATLTRSPILGAVVFLVIYLLTRPTSWYLIIGLLASVAIFLVGPMVMDLLQESAPRVVRADDGSVMARFSMNTFGVLLIADNPLGYGYTFNPRDHWHKFWQFLYHTPEPEALIDKELHNYALSMLNTYGVGILLLMPLIFEALKRARYALLFFVPYMIHILFHNSGPYWNDIPFWFGVAVLGVARGAKRREEPFDDYTPTYEYQPNPTRPARNHRRIPSS